MRHIGQRVRAVREAKGLTQQFVAEQRRVVHSTVHADETKPDLKSSVVRSYAQILEVTPTYLMGDDAELDALDVTVVVRRESLRLFLAGESFDDRQRRRFERIRDHVAAPTTVKDWRALHELIRVFLGRPPEQRTRIVEDSATRDAASDRTKRMARMQLTDRTKSMLQRVV